MQRHITVTDQDQLDAALGNPEIFSILVQSSPNATLILRANPRQKVIAGGHTKIEALAGALLHAVDEAEVKAGGGNTVWAADRARVLARHAALIWARDEAHVVAYDHVQVHAKTSAAVHAYHNARVMACDKVTVLAPDDSSIEARGTAVVRAYGSAVVQAGSHVAVYRMSKRSAVTGGVVFHCDAGRGVGLNDWLEYQSVTVLRGPGEDMAVLYKATDALLTAGHMYGKPTVYRPGGEVRCDDWRDDHQCGGGLHFSPTLHQAVTYRRDAGDARYLRVHVRLRDLRVLDDDKCKAPSAYVDAEVDAFGRDITARGHS